MAVQAPPAARQRHECGPRERALVLVGVAVIAVHVIDDSFIQPQPGTSATDHLVSGLVPLAALGLAGVAYPRLRAGARAVLALALGLFGISTASEAWYYTREVGASGDDYTGLLVIPAALLLLGVGVVTLWRSRRLDDGLARRYLRRALIGLAALVAAAFVVYPVVYSYGLTHIGRAVVPEPELGAAFEEVSFTTDDGLELEGWYVPSRNRAAVIAFPGRRGPQRQTRMLVRHGYGVLLFDRRGEGDSEGDPNGIGWNGDRDLKAAIEFLRDRPDVDPERIGGIGLSVGGELLLETAAETEALRAVVSEGAGIRSVREAMLGPLGGVPIWGLMTAATAIYSNHAPPPSLDDLVGRISPRPVFLIYATRGQGGEELSQDYYESAGEPRVVWKAPGGHTGAIEARPREYERRVIAFFDEALRPAAARAGGG